MEQRIQDRTRSGLAWVILTIMFVGGFVLWVVFNPVAYGSVVFWIGALLMGLPSYCFTEFLGGWGFERRFLKTLPRSARIMFGVIWALIFLIIISLVFIFVSSLVAK